jgi:hypothetical protein
VPLEIQLVFGVGRQRRGLVDRHTLAVLRAKPNDASAARAAPDLKRMVSADILAHPGTRQPLFEIDQPGACLS